MIANDEHGDNGRVMMNY